jgi:hypothetical protein
VKYNRGGGEILGQEACAAAVIDMDVGRNDIGQVVEFETEFRGSAEQSGSIGCRSRLYQHGPGPGEQIGDLMQRELIVRRGIDEVRILSYRGDVHCLAKAFAALRGIDDTTGRVSAENP